jgi:DNA-binding CsgD family transcriptional regulator
VTTWLVSDHSTSNTPLLISTGMLLVGRQKNNELWLSDLSVSRRHARITVQSQNEYSIEDLQSQNGTFVNDDRIQVSRFGSGDTLRFGSVDVRVVSQEDVPKLTDDPSTRGNLQEVFDMVDSSELLSPAQQRVYELLAQGIPEKQIASKLYLSYHTVHNHVREIYRRLGVTSKTELIHDRLTRKHVTRFNQ